MNTWACSLRKQRIDVLLSLVFALVLSLLLSGPVSADEDGWTGAGDVRTELGYLHYRTAGKGQPLLLLHGYFGQGAQWSKYLDQLTRHFTVIAPDLPGHGRSANRSDEFDPQVVARAVWRLVDELGYGKISGVGYSAGGMTLLAMAAEQPRRVHAMVLAASAHSVAPSARVPWEDLPAGFQADMLRNHPGGVEQVKKLIAIHTIPSVDASRVEGLRVPALLVVGDRDASFPLENIIETHRLLVHSKLWVLPDLGHELFWAEWGGSRELEQDFPLKLLDFLAEPY